MKSAGSVQQGTNEYLSFQDHRSLQKKQFQLTPSLRPLPGPQEGCGGQEQAETQEPARPGLLRVLPDCRSGAQGRRLCPAKPSSREPAASYDSGPRSACCGVENNLRKTSSEKGMPDDGTWGACSDKGRLCFPLMSHFPSPFENHLRENHSHRTCQKRVQLPAYLNAV